jgi:23S rRNA (adenine2030-N6)-methyltransferase
MNYRHAFHAGNFADVFKHIILTRILLHLREKVTAFRVIDTHAGAGLYDLAGSEAARTGEWRDGIGRLFDAALPAAAAALIAPHLAAVRDFNPDGGLKCYPGSPLLCAHLMRPQDRLMASELETVAAAALSRHLREIPNAGANAIDGWVALNAYVPPKERRGIVIVDPAYEQRDDFARLADGLTAAHRKWPTGIYLAWYPIKGRDGPDLLGDALRRASIAKCLRVELTVRAAAVDDGLGACGVIVINPPWRLAAELDVVLPALAAGLGRDAARGFRLDWLSQEKPDEKRR